MLLIKPLIVAMVAIAALGLMASCAQPAAIMPVPTTCAPTNSSATGSVNTSPRQGPVTFYEDILPILESNRTGNAYKCTTCHAHYARPDGLNNVPELERVVESMRSGRMPRGGDPVPGEKVELFTMWRLQGFQDGVRAVPSSGTAQSDQSQNCP